MIKGNVRVRLLVDDTAYNDAHTGLKGTLTMDDEQNRPRLHDGVTQGGHEIAMLADLGGGLTVNDILDTLTSTETQKALSANQGRVLKELIDNINAVLQSDDVTLDELQEVVDFIKMNREDLDNLAINNIAGLPAALNNKVAKVAGKALSSNDYTDAYRNKLDGIEAGAQRNVGTDLRMGGSGNNRLVVSSTGDSVSVPLASATTAGFMSMGFYTKLDGIEYNAQKNVPTDLSVGGSGDNRTMVSSTGRNTGIPLVSSTTAGFMSINDKQKLDSITGTGETAATNLSLGGSGNNRTINSSTGNNVSVPLVSQSTAGFISTQDKIKLDGIQTGAQRNRPTTDARDSSSTTTVLEAKAMDDHTSSGDHDDRYYTQPQVDAMLGNSFVPLFDKKLFGGI